MAPLRSDSLPMPPTPVPTMPARGNCSPQPYAPLTSLVEALSNSIVLPTMDCYAAEASFGLQMKQIATVHPVSLTSRYNKLQQITEIKGAVGPLRRCRFVDGPFPTLSKHGPQDHNDNFHIRFPHHRSFVRCSRSSAGWTGGGRHPALMFTGFGPRSKTPFTSRSP